MRKLLLILLLILPINAFSLSREEAKQKLSSDPAWVEGVYRVSTDWAKYDSYGEGTEILIISDGGKDTYNIYNIYSQHRKSGALVGNISRTAQPGVYIGRENISIRVIGLIFSDSWEMHTVPVEYSQPNFITLTMEGNCNTCEYTKRISITLKKIYPLRPKPKPKPKPTYKWEDKPAAVPTEKPEKEKTWIEKQQDKIEERRTEERYCAFKAKDAKTDAAAKLIYKACMK